MILQRFLCNISSPVTIIGANSVSFPPCKTGEYGLPPRVKFNLGLSLLLLLAGDVSLNPGPVAPNLRPGTVNARSMKDNAPALSDLVVSKSIDLLGITGTWLTTRETSGDLAEMTPHGFSFLQTPRVNKRGGGVAFSSRMPLNSPQSACLPNPVSNLYLAN